MAKDRARKAAARAVMAETGLKYTEALRIADERWAASQEERGDASFDDDSAESQI